MGVFFFFYILECTPFQKGFDVEESKQVITNVISLVNPGALRKHAYSNILKILPPKKENFQIKNSDIFHISAQNIDCVYPLEPPRWVPTIYVFEQN